MSLRRHSRRFALSLLIAGVIAVLVTGLFTRGQLDLIQLQFGDTFFRTKPVEKARASVIIGVDEKSLAALKDDGRFFNWPRRLHARVIENLYNAGARVIVFDMLFDARSEDDDELARAMKMVNADPRRAIVQPVAGDESGIQSNVYGEPIAYSDLLQPLPKLLEAAPIVGHTNQFPDPDGSIRRVPLVIRVGDQRIPALPLVAVAKWLRRPQVLEGPAENGYLPFPGRQLPIDGFYRMFVNWLGPPSVVGDANSSVPQISYVDVLNNNFDPALVKDKMAFLGVTAGYFADDYWVPTARVVKMDGVEIHAQTAETIAGKQGGGISAGLFAPPPDWVTILLIFSAAILMALAVYALSPLAAVGIGLAAIFLYMVAAQYFFIQGALLNLFAPPLSLVLAFAALMVNRIALEQREQRVLKSLFASYVPADVVQELANEPDQMRRRGGERREITVLFCDLKGFTSFSETVEPEVLAEVINRYLTAMTRVIFEYRGTVDKYIGDALLAFWNAPPPIAQHAANACSAALKMQAELRVLSAEQEALGMPPLRQRVGINTGIAPSLTRWTEAWMAATICSARGGCVAERSPPLALSASPRRNSMVAALFS